MRRKPKETRMAHVYPDEVKRSMQMTEAKKRTGATDYELEYFFQTGKRLPRVKEEKRDE